MDKTLKTILVAGGAGYIGSHVVRDLKARGYAPVIVDNFSMGNRDLAGLLSVPVCEGSLDDAIFLKQVFTEHAPSAVMHFAAFAYVGESVHEPLKYYQNNLAATITLLRTMQQFGVKEFIFSSTCATYGIPKKLPISEETPQNPINPYGYSKLAVERILFDCDRAYGMRSVIFRYFNAAGASADALIGERHDPETHLIPLAINAAFGKEQLVVFGDDYPTHDGTCTRDYIHISDISDAHIRGLEYLQKGGKTDAFNIGTEKGNTVKEVIDCIEQVSGKKVNFVVKERREGDPAALVASAKKLRTTLNWVPKYPDLKQIIETAVRWHVADNDWKA
jgi:UDP-glucose 4-epimerase